MRSAINGGLALLLGVALSAAAQEETPTFKSGVKLVEVPVVVRDRDGRAVTGLHKEDFELFDRGRRQEIASCAETKPGEQVAPDRSKAGGAGIVIPERFIAFVFDDVAIWDSADLTRIRDAASRRLGELQPSDRAAVLTTSCRVMLDFTDDRAKLQEAASKITYRPVAVCRVSPSQVLQLSVLNSLLPRMAVLPGQRSITLISPGFYVGHDRSAEEAELIDAAVHSKVLIDALDVGGVGGASIAPVDPYDRPGRPSYQQRYYPPNNPVTLTELTHGTGGTYVAAGNDFDTGFRKLATPESYYLLGFSPGAVKADGSYHELKVKLKDPHKVTVQARGGYYAPARAKD